MSKKVLERYSVDFLLTSEEEKKVHGKYPTLNDVTGMPVVEGELYFVGYETEEGEECDEDGKLL